VGLAGVDKISEMTADPTHQNGPPTERRGGGGAFAPPELVRALRDSILNDRVARHLSPAPLPRPDRVRLFVDLVRQAVFPGFFGAADLREEGLEEHLGPLLEQIGEMGSEQVRRALRYARHLPAGKADDPACAECDAEATRIMRSFLAHLPALRASIALDVQAAYDGDPAARHTDETILCYPGVAAVVSYRIARRLLVDGAPMVPRIIAELAHSDTGIDIHPGAQIGEGFFIDHGAGVVIGETAIIGNNVKLYQGVTLGAKSFPLDERGEIIRGQKRHPTLGDRVTIYAGAVILGGDTVIGDDCVISGGVFLTGSVPPKHVVRQKQPELVMRANRSAPEI